MSETELSIPAAAPSEPIGERPRGGVRGASTVIGDLASVSGARVASALLSAVTVVITTHLLRPRGYALVAYVTVISTLMFTATSGWTAAAVTRYGREELESGGSMVKTSWARLLTSLPIAGIASLFVLALELLGALPAGMTWAFVWLALAAGLLAIVSEHVVNLLEAAGRMRLTALGLSLRQALVVAALAIVIVARGHVSPAGVIALNVATLAVVATLIAVPVWRLALWPPRLDLAHTMRILSFSAPMIAFSLSQYVIRSVDVVVLGVFGSAASVGEYAVAYQGYGVLQQIATTVTIVLTPLVVSLGLANKHDLLRRYVVRAVPQLAFLTAAMAAVAIPLLAVAVPLVFGQPFRGATTPLAVLCVAFVLYACSCFTAPIVMLHERSGRMAVVSVAAAIFNCAADLLLVGPLHMGLFGPALATALSLTITAAGYLAISMRCMDVSHSYWRVASRILLLLTPAVAATAATLLLPAGAAILVGVPGAALCIAAILRWGSPFAPEDAALIARLDMPEPVRRLALRFLV